MGSLDPPTLSAGEPGSVYNEVGYAGMVWHNYDLGCAGTAFNPASTTDTWLGNQAFNVAKFAVGGVNWSHYLISGGGNLLAPLDGVIRGRDVGHVPGRLHHVDRPRAGRALGHPARARHPR